MFDKHRVSPVGGDEPEEEGAYGDREIRHRHGNAETRRLLNIDGSDDVNADNRKAKVESGFEDEHQAN
jgi:hypothetical protein